MADLSKMAVQSKPCKTCPFAGEKPISLSPGRMQECIENLIQFKGQHFCHSASNKKICRGGKDIQVKALFAAGYLDAPTEEAFNLEINRMNP